MHVIICATAGRRISSSRAILPSSTRVRQGHRPRQRHGIVRRTAAARTPELRACEEGSRRKRYRPLCCRLCGSPCRCNSRSSPDGCASGMSRRATAKRSCGRLHADRRPREADGFFRMAADCSPDRRNAEGCWTRDGRCLCYMRETDPLSWTCKGVQVAA